MGASTGFPLSPFSTTLSTLHRPSSNIWHLELHNGADNRLTDTFIHSSVMPALDMVQSEWEALPASEKGKKNANGALIISGKLGQDRFFSNGLDLPAALKRGPSFWSETFYPFMKRLLLFPIPTICAINGHAFAGGMTVAMLCDYRVMISHPPPSASQKKKNAWMSMNEVHFGAPLPSPFAILYRAKGPTPSVTRAITIEGKRFEPEECLHIGLVDALGKDTEDVLNKARELGEKWGGNASGGVWGRIKRDVYYDVVQALESTEMPKFDSSQKSKL